MTDERPPILAVDLDGTIIDEKTEELIPGAKDALVKLHENGWKIVIWTARGDAETYVPKVLSRHGIPYDAVNSNLPGIEDKSRKIYFDAIVDNKNVDFGQDWESVVGDLEHRRDGWKNVGVTKANIYQVDPVDGKTAVVQKWELDGKGRAVLVAKDGSEVVKDRVVEDGRGFLRSLVEENYGTYRWAELA